MLCNKCSQIMHTHDVGVCTACGASTNSSSFSLCDHCSQTKKECKACRRKLGPNPPRRR